MPVKIKPDLIRARIELLRSIVNRLTLDPTIAHFIEEAHLTHKRVHTDYDPAFAGLVEMLRKQEGWGYEILDKKGRELIETTLERLELKDCSGSRTVLAISAHPFFGRIYSTEEMPDFGEKYFQEEYHLPSII